MPQLITGVVGSVHHPGAREALKELLKGEILTLRREKDNPYDRNAVAVLDCCGQMLGYIPRSDAPAIAKVLDSGLIAKAQCLRKGTNAVQINWETKAYVQQP